MKETKRIGVEYVALYDSIPTTKDEIAMLKGDNILVYTIYRDGWCRCLLNGREEGVDGGGEEKSLPTEQHSPG